MESLVSYGSEDEQEDVEVSSNRGDLQNSTAQPRSSSSSSTSEPSVKQSGKKSKKRKHIDVTATVLERERNNLEMSEDSDDSTQNSSKKQESSRRNVSKKDKKHGESSHDYHRRDALPKESSKSHKSERESSHKSKDRSKNDRHRDHHEVKDKHQKKSRRSSRERKLDKIDHKRNKSHNTESGSSSHSTDRDRNRNSRHSASAKERKETSKYSPKHDERRSSASTRHHKKHSSSPVRCATPKEERSKLATRKDITTMPLNHCRPNSSDNDNKVINSHFSGGGGLGESQQRPLPLKHTVAVAVTTTQPSIAKTPTFFNPPAIVNSKYAEQMQKRKLLWGNKKADTEKWNNAKFAQDTDGRVASKFMRLMGIKDAPKEEAAGPLKGSAGGGVDTIKKQEELFSNMEQQYEVARQVTHTMRGVGLGFGSQPRPF